MLLSVSFIDVSGGYSTSILDAIRNAVLASKSIYIKNEEQLSKEQQQLSKEQQQLLKESQYKPITLDEAFFMATLGGAQGTIQSLIYLTLKSM